MRFAGGRNRSAINLRFIPDGLFPTRFFDTVFNPEHYNLFISALERTAKTIVKLTGKKPTQVDLCEYLNNRAKWKEEIDVLIACDIPTGAQEILPIPARKRIQAAVYNKDCIHEFQIKD